MRKKISACFIFFIAICILASSVGTFDQVRAEGTAKQEYTERYKKLNKKCKKKFEWDLPQQEMNQNAYKEYCLWDDELNYIYNDIFPKLNDEQKKELTASELKWIEKKEKKAKVEASTNEGGSLYPLIYYTTLTRLTKKRIRWLIENYA